MDALILKMEALKAMNRRVKACHVDPSEYLSSQLGLSMIVLQQLELWTKYTAPL